MSDHINHMMANLLSAAEKVKRVDDNLLLAIAAIAATGNVQIAEMPPMHGYKPVILMPPHMYQRMLELIPPQST